MLRPAIERANEKLVEGGRPAIARNVTLHALRRTYISLLLESGENPRAVMAQVGHADWSAMEAGVCATLLRRAITSCHVSRGLA